jgi:NADH:ubiquinone oxidoreductase subunit B-like Fe-S oxidoreductase
LLYGILQLQKKIRREGSFKRWWSQNCKKLRN